MDQLFQKLSKPFPAEAYKDVKIGRGFTTIDAYHIVERLTEVFGMCGDRWGVSVDEWRENGPNVACIGFLWYRKHEDEEVCRVAAVGDAQVIKGNIAEAYKKAMTNLISKASSFIGVGLSVYQGKGIDDPYLDREHVQNTAPTKKPVDMAAMKTDKGKAFLLAFGDPFAAIVELEKSKQVTPEVEEYIKGLYRENS